MGREEKERKSSYCRSFPASQLLTFFFSCLTYTYSRACLLPAATGGLDEWGKGEGWVDDSQLIYGRALPIGVRARLAMGELLSK